MQIGALSGHWVGLEQPSQSSPMQIGVGLTQSKSVRHSAQWPSTQTLGHSESLRHWPGEPVVEDSKLPVSPVLDADPELLSGAQAISGSRMNNDPDRGSNRW
jgi:hypothetical protein